MTKGALVRLVVLGAFAVVVVLAIAVALRSEGTYEVRAVFDDVRGLIEGGEVKAGGVDVGSVEEISFTDDGVPEATLEIDSDFRLRQGAFANIRLASNVGAINRFVDLTQGEGPELEDGAVLGPSQTDHPVDFDLAVSTLDPRTRKAAGELLANLDAATRGRGPDLARTVRNSAEALGETADLLAEVTADGRALRQLVGDGATVVSALAQNPTDLGETAEGLALALDAGAARQSELARTSDAIGPGLESAAETLVALTRSVPNLRELVRTARPAVAELSPTAAALRPATAALRPLVAEVRRVTAPMREQLRAIQPVIDAAVPVTMRLPGVLGMLGPVLDQLRANGPEVVNFFTLFGDATSNYDANGNLIRTMAVLTQFNRHPNVIPRDSNEPGGVERPFYRIPGTAEGEPWHDYWKSFIAGAKPVEGYLEADDVPPEVQP
ncbi:MAG TPA: MlaD family protein [Solirubrobacterales bacterium]|nr:MlaD family protein [Solirubrobacterales bacterium]